VSGKHIILSSTWVGAMVYISSLGNREELNVASVISKDLWGQ